MTGTNLTIGVKELTFLAALSDGETLLGIEDPFDGWLAHQVEEEWEKIAPEMEAKQLIKRKPDGEIAVDDTIADIIKTCCFPSGCIILSRWEKEGQPANSCYYITKEMLVEKVDLESEYSCYLNVLQEPSVIAKRLELSIPVNNMKDNTTRGGEVPSSVIEEIRACAQNEQERATSLLQEKCPTFAEPALLVSDLIAPLSYNILIFSDFRTDPANAYGFSVLEGSKGTWKMRAFNKGEQEWLEVKSCSKDILDQELAKIDRKVKALANN